MSGLPIRNISKKSDEEVRLFFDRYYTKPISLTDNDLNSVVGFFEAKGFDIQETYNLQLDYFINCLKQSKLPMNNINESADTLNILLKNGEKIKK